MEGLPAREGPRLSSDTGNWTWSEFSMTTSYILEGQGDYVGLASGSGQTAPLSRERAQPNPREMKAGIQQEDSCTPVFIAALVR